MELAIESSRENQASLLHNLEENRLQEAHERSCDKEENKRQHEMAMQVAAEKTEERRRANELQLKHMEMTMALARQESEERRRASDLQSKQLMALLELLAKKQ